MWEYVVDNKLKEKSEVRNKTIWEKNVNDQRGGYFLVWALLGMRVEIRLICPRDKLSHSIMWKW
jgi:hypothetical protein